VLDDFGTGYSSFQHLKDFPIDTIKIDRSFVANLGRSSQDAAIVASVVSMASALGLGVVAEGVENETQAQLLRELGCPLAQGYFFGAPT
jgi:EAL domain-containing protein (putative c-di-GMP-specific phosphodiesterase class I)